MIGNETTFMIHGSVVASTLAVIDILGAGRALNTRYYLALVFLVTRALRRIERAKLRHLAPLPD